MPLFRENSGKFSPEKTVALIATVLPVLWLAGRALAGDLGGRPVAAALHFTGLWAVRFLLLSLAVTPVRRAFQWPKLVLARRTLGLAVLGYALLHLGLYVMDQGWNITAAAREIAVRFYLTIGALAVVLLLALGATSFDSVIRRMGGRRWNRLHMSVYAIAVLAIVHFLIQSKLDVTEAVLMGGLLIYLLAYRVTHHVTNKVGPARLAGLAVLAALLTGLGEIAWYAAMTGIDPWRVAEANFDPSLGISPAAWVLASGLAFAVSVWARNRFMPKVKPAGKAGAARSPRLSATSSRGA